MTAAPVLATFSTLEAKPFSEYLLPRHFFLAFSHCVSITSGFSAIFAALTIFSNSSSSSASDFISERSRTPSAHKSRTFSLPSSGCFLMSSASFFSLLLNLKKLSFILRIIFSINSMNFLPIAIIASPNF